MSTDEKKEMLDAFVTNKEILRRASFSVFLAAAIVLVWCWVSFALDQPFFAPQVSRKLMTVGAANGALFASGEWWRILTSQFLHVHFLHMLFNAGCIAVVGAFLEQRCGWRTVAVVYVVGGCAGQLASVVSYPDLVSSGASQALMALCGAALLLLHRSPRLFALAIVTIQAALDVYVAQKIKAGHSIGFLAGLVLGALWLFFVGRRATRSVQTGQIH